jgi:hypothetical protein
VKRHPSSAVGNNTPQFTFVVSVVVFIVPIVVANNVGSVILIMIIVVAVLAVAVYAGLRGINWASGCKYRRESINAAWVY